MALARSPRTHASEPRALDIALSPGANAVGSCHDPRLVHDSPNAVARSAHSFHLVRANSPIGREMPTLTVNRYQHYYLDEGTGEPLIMLAMGASIDTSNMGRRPVPVVTPSSRLGSSTCTRPAEASTEFPASTPS